MAFDWAFDWAFDLVGKVVEHWVGYVGVVVEVEFGLVGPDPVVGEFEEDGLVSCDLVPDLVEVDLVVVALAEAVEDLSSVEMAARVLHYLVHDSLHVASVDLWGCLID